MKKALLCISSVIFAATLLLTGCASSKYQAVANVSKLQISFADSNWDGKSIPVGQRCTDRSGDKNPHTPALTVSNIPQGANALIISYSDSSYQPMDNGGHGVMMYKIKEGSTSVNVPAVAGHTDSLPSGFKIISANSSSRFNGAYLPPCSGGKGNLYYVTIQAVYDAKENGKLFATGEMDLGRY